MDAKEQRLLNSPRDKSDSRANEKADEGDDLDDAEEDSGDEDYDLSVNDDDEGDDKSGDDDDDGDEYQQQPSAKKETQAKQQQLDNCESNFSNAGQEDENLKLKKKFDIPLFRSYGPSVSGAAGAREKDEKKTGEKKAVAIEKKVVDKAAKAKRLKTLDKKAGKMTANALAAQHHRAKRSLKEKVKDMVQKLKLKGTHNVESDKKKRLTAEELSKVSVLICVQNKPPFN